MGCARLCAHVYLFTGGLSSLVWVLWPPGLSLRGSWGFFALPFLMEGPVLVFCHLPPPWVHSIFGATFFNSHCIYLGSSGLLALFFLMPCLWASCFRLPWQPIPSLFYFILRVFPPLVNFHFSYFLTGCVGEVVSSFPLFSKTMATIFSFMIHHAC